MLIAFVIDFTNLIKPVRKLFIFSIIYPYRSASFSNRSTPAPISFLSP